MAIKFRDSEPEGPKKAPKEESAKPAKQSEPEPGSDPAADGELPGLGLAKSEPKKRGRKKPFG